MTRPRRTPLTTQQTAILELLSRGFTREEVARELRISMNTVKEHLKRLFATLGVRRVSHAVRVGFERGVLRLDVTDDDTEVLPGYAHAPHVCAPGPCCLHAPSDHPLRDWPRRWRDDRGLMERRCEHGIGHPDPDHVAHVRRRWGDEAARSHEVHGCDGCCRVAFVSRAVYG